MNENNPLDIVLLQGYLDNLNVAIVQKMLDLYTQQSALYLDEISLAISNQSQSHWQESCHKMKGAAGSTGLLMVHQKLVGMEKSTAAWQLKKTTVTELSQLNEQAKTAFQQWLS